MARPDGVPENLKKYLGAVNCHQKPLCPDRLLVSAPDDLRARVVVW